MTSGYFVRTSQSSDTDKQHWTTTSSSNPDEFDHSNRVLQQTVSIIGLVITAIIPTILRVMKRYYVSCNKYPTYGKTAKFTPFYSEPAQVLCQLTNYKII